MSRNFKLSRRNSHLQFYAMLNQYIIHRCLSIQYSRLHPVTVVLYTCMNRFIYLQTIIMPKQREHRRAWTQNEDQLLRRAVDSNTNDDQKPQWKLVAIYINQCISSEFPRNAKQCRQRWCNALNPISKQTIDWGIQQDVQLIRACKKYGHRWSKLVGQFNGRITDNRLKNHFYSNVRKIIRYLNHFIKDQKHKYQQIKKNGEIMEELYEDRMKQVNKLRNFDIKLLSKVFSLMDSKQQYKYQVTEAMQKTKIQLLNNQILDFIQSHITESEQFSKQRILTLIVDVMMINRSIKTKYVRESKMSLQKQEDIQKNALSKKKIEKKLNNLIKQKLQDKIIPDKKIKEQIIEQLMIENNKHSKLIENAFKKKKTRSVWGENADIQISSYDVESSNYHEKLEAKEKKNAIKNSEIYQKTHKNNNINNFSMSSSGHLNKNIQGQNRSIFKNSRDLLNQSFNNYHLQERKNSASQQILRSSFQYYNGGNPNSINSNKQSFGSLILKRSGGIQESQQKQNNKIEIEDKQRGQSNRQLQSSFLSRIQDLGRHSQNQSNLNQNSLMVTQTEKIGQKNQHKNQTAMNNDLNIRKILVPGANHTIVDAGNSKSQGFFQFSLPDHRYQNKNQQDKPMFNSIQQAKFENENLSLNKSGLLGMFENGINLEKSNDNLIPKINITLESSPKGLFTSLCNNSLENKSLNNNNYANINQQQQKQQQQQQQQQQQNLVQNPFAGPQSIFSPDLFNLGSYNNFTNNVNNYNTIGLQLSRELSLHNSSLYNNNNNNSNSNMLMESRNIRFDFYQSIDYQHEKMDNLDESLSYGRKSGNN